MNATKEMCDTVKEQEPQEPPNADINPFMSGRANTIKVTLARKADYNRIKGSKITAKNHSKTRTPLPAKPKGSGIHHPGSHPASEEGASREGASSGGRHGVGTFTTTSLGSPVYSTAHAHGRAEDGSADERRHGSVEAKKTKDANHGVFTGMSAPAHAELSPGGSAH